LGEKEEAQRGRKKKKKNPVPEWKDTIPGEGQIITLVVGGGRSTEIGHGARTLFLRGRSWREKSQKVVK